MKTTLLTLAILFACGSLAPAQTQKGRWTVGGQVGSLSYRSSTTELLASRTATVLLSPSAGYFVANNVAVGAPLPIYYGYNRSQYAPIYSYTSTQISITQVGLSPFVRVYVGAAKLRPFVSASVGFTQAWSTLEDLNNARQNRTRDSFFTYGGSAGVAYFINQNVSLDASLGYSGGDQTNVADLVNNTSSRPETLVLSIGFRVFLGQ